MIRGKRTVTPVLIILLLIGLTGCDMLNGADANAPWKGTWSGVLEFVDGGYPVRSTITAQISQQGDVLTGTLTIRTSTTDPALTSDTTLRASLSAVLVGVDEVEAVGSLECTSISGTVDTFTFTSCSELPAYTQTGSFEADLLAQNTIRASLPDFASAYPEYADIRLNRK